MWSQDLNSTQDIQLQSTRCQLQRYNALIFNSRRGYNEDPDRKNTEV